MVANHWLDQPAASFGGLLKPPLVSPCVGPLDAARLTSKALSFEVTYEIA